MTQSAINRSIAGVGRILIVKLADLGDAVLATPAINAIRRAYPDARIDVLTTQVGAGVLAMCPAIDRLITFPKRLFDQPLSMFKPTNASELARLGWQLRHAKYDALVLLHHLTTAFGATKFQLLARACGARVIAGLDNGRGAFLTHRAIDYGFGVLSEWEYGLEIAATIGGRSGSDASLVMPKSATIRANALLKSHGTSKPFVVIHPGVGTYSQARQWPIERFTAVARSLVATGQVVIVAVGTTEERGAALPLLAEPGVTELMGETSIASLAGILSLSSVVVGADSGICHLAAAIGTPTISIFGPSSHRAWCPIGVPATEVDMPSPAARHVILRSGIACSPCFYVGYGLGRPEGCAIRTCLQQVTSDQVLKASIALLAATESTAKQARSKSSP